MDKKLKSIYYNPNHAAGYSSLDKLYNSVKGRYRKSDVKTWLQKQDAYTMHKQARKKFKRNHYFVTNIDEIWQSDLNDMRALRKYNKNYSYLLTIIDIFSKFGWAVPLKDKQGKTVTKAFAQVFKNSKRKPSMLNTDKGKEYCNSQFQNFLKTHKVGFYTTQNPDTKAAVCERFNRTLKNKMWRYFTHKNTKTYINVLPRLLDSYNKSVHSSINKAPRDVNENNVLEVWKYLYKDMPRMWTQKNYSTLNKGDKVRITRERGRFDKSYYGNWTREIFIVNKILKRYPPVYKLKDLQNEEVKGVFYSQEIQKVTTPDKSSLYQVDKILKHRKTGSNHEVLVHWRGYPAKFRSWILFSDLKKI